MNKVIVVAANEAYLNHAKSLMVNCLVQGQWDGEFCLIHPKGLDVSDFTSRGIHEYPVDDDGTWMKLAIWEDYFQMWDIVFHIDCDCMVVGPLDKILPELEQAYIIGDREPFDLEFAFTHWNDPAEIEANAEIYQWLRGRFDVTTKMFNGGIILFKPSKMPVGIPETIAEFREIVKSINRHTGVAEGTDQPLVNMAVCGLWAPVRNQLFAYHGCEGPETVLMHYCRWDAPWLLKHNCKKLGMMCKSVYDHNLAIFNTIFPRV